MPKFNLSRGIFDKKDVFLFNVKMGGEKAVFRV